MSQHSDTFGTLRSIIHNETTHELLPFLQAAHTADPNTYYDQLYPYLERPDHTQPPPLLFVQNQHDLAQIDALLPPCWHVKLLDAPTDDTSCLDWWRNDPRLYRVALLQMNWCNLGQQGVEQLATIKGLYNLTGLILVDRSLDASCIRTLTTAHFWPHLQLLSLTCSYFDFSSVWVITGSPPDQLHDLDLADNRIHTEGLRDIILCPGLQDLRSLNVSNNRIGALGPFELTRTSALPRLHTLHLSTNKLEDEGATYLANATHLTELRNLSLAANHITDTGLQALAAAPHLQRLQRLNLSDNPITDEGLHTLASTDMLQHLNMLAIDRTNCTEEGLAAFRQALTRIGREDQCHLCYTTKTNQ